VKEPQAKTSPPGEATADTLPDRRRQIGLFLGPAVFLFMLFAPAPDGLSVEGWRTAAAGLLLAIWWITEAIPIPATSLLPLVLFPLLEIQPIRNAAAPYANPLIFLFMGGFIIALAMERWNLHRRIALAVVRAIGVRPSSVVLGFMVASAFLSMWVSNTATAVMMLPIGLSVILLVRPDTEYGEGQPLDFNFALCLMLGIAYAASIGGLATLIGTPPNALLAAFMLEAYGVEIGFVQWMIVGLPLVVISIPIVWLSLTRIIFPIKIREIPGGAVMIREQYRMLGPVSYGEKAVAVVFTGTAFLWIFRPVVEQWLPGLSDAGIAMIGALALFIIPMNRRLTRFVMDWESAAKLPWGVLILCGGGLALADAVTATGLAEWIALALRGLGEWPTPVLVLAVILLIIFLTELTSNTATAAAFLPLVAALAVGVGENPLLLVVPAAIAASCAFMMPVATPPNAIVYGSGYVTIPQMVQAGWRLNILFAGLITLVVYSLVVLAFGAEPGVLPDWAIPDASIRAE
jgi:solute carrier family 13 (sodium-dependent dicarboxylate transporter), member 2/3/5